MIESMQVDLIRFTYADFFFHLKVTWSPLGSQESTLTQTHMLIVSWISLIMMNLWKLDEVCLLNVAFEFVFEDVSALHVASGWLWTSCAPVNKYIYI